MTLDVLPLIACTPPTLHELYAGAMRNSLFTGFLTLCGFLLTAKTFLVVNMNKEVYASEHYLENFRVQQKLAPGLEVYAPLNNIARLLHWNIVLAIATSASQFTIGFIDHPAAALVCMALAVSAFVYLVVSLFRIRDNLTHMFAYLESAARSKIVELQKKADLAREQRRSDREKEITDNPVTPSDKAPLPAPSPDADTPLKG